MKYLIIEDGGIGTPILFPDHINHIDMAKGLGVRSAGQCELVSFEGEVCRVKCWGRSVSLNLNSLSGDEIPIEQMLKWRRY